MTDPEGGFLSPILQILTQHESRSSSSGTDVRVPMLKVSSWSHTYGFPSASMKSRTFLIFRTVT